MSKDKPKFDYHLDKEEKDSIEKLVPLHQAKIHMAMRCDFTIDRTKYPQGAICVSEHMITFGKKRLLGKAFNLADQFHLFDIEQLETTSQYKFTIVTDEHEYTVYTPEAIKLCRTILRDYILSASLIPPQERFRFIPHDPQLFPPFNPPISPSQAFQFTYNAYCSYFDATYYHEVVQFYHKNLNTTQGIVNMNELPFGLLETNLRNPMDLSPFFMALRFSPYIFGISCTNVTRPDILTAISPLIEDNSNIHFLSLEHCNIDKGIDSLSQAIESNKDIKISYWDLSDNKFNDATPFMAALVNYPSPIFFLNFDHCNLSQTATDLLFKAISINKNLWNLNYLHISGAKITEKTAEQFKRHLRNMKEKGIQNLRSINFGGISSGLHIILESLVSYPQPLEKLRIQNTRIKKESLTALRTVISRYDSLYTLDISNTGLSVEEVLSVIKSIQNNNNIVQFELMIGGLGLNGKKLERVIKAMLETPNIWSLLQLNDSGLTPDDVRFLNKHITEFPNLIELRLNNNFKQSQKGIGENLSALCKREQIQALSIRGSKSNSLCSQIEPVLKALEHNEHIKYIDIRSNYIGDSGLAKLAETVSANDTLLKLKYDGSRPKHVERVLDVMKAVSESISLIHCKMPADDVFKSLMKVKGKERSTLEPQVAEQQDKVYMKLMTNLANQQIVNFMKLKNIPELDEVIEELTGQLAEALQKTNIHEHSAVGSLLGLKLPFQNVNDNDTQSQVVEVQNTGAEAYDTQDASKRIIETVGEDLSQLTTLQFNSLIIKRPSLNSRTNLTGIKPPTENDLSDTSSESSSKNGESKPLPKVTEMQSKLASSDSDSDSDSSESRDSESSSDPRRKRAKHKH